MTVLVIAEHDNHVLKPSTFNTITAAQSCGQDIHILVAGWQCDAVAQKAAQIAGINKVLHTEAQHLSAPLAENITAQIVAIIHSNPSYTHLLAPANTSGKNFMPRVAAKLDMAQISDVIRIEDSHTFVRPIYAGNAIATVQTNDAIKILTVRTTAFPAASLSTQHAPIEKIAAVNDTGLSLSMGCETVPSSRPELTSARVVVSGGRGLGSSENYSNLIEPLADKLSAAMGASRAAVDAGFVANEYQVGQTGKIVAPELYIAVGISGAIQHLAGMKESKVIVAINKDPDAPIFGVADYGLVGDLFELIPALTKALP
ncbi:MAG: FAD-binding protein [Ottowia sp.]|nr:FAD-binding protein [Ottowia sp.]